MRLRIDGLGRVRADASVEAPMSAHAAWGQMRDARRFLAMDPFHQAVHTPASSSPMLSRGDELVIPHRFLGLGPDRVGRVLVWKEGRGYAVSDLSARGVRFGFPHTCAYWLVPIGSESCRLRIEVRGRWTAAWVPRWAARAWVWWVLQATEARIAAEFRCFARARRGSI